MAKKYVSLEKLGKFYEEAKKVTDAADAKVLSDAKEYSDSLAENYEAAGASATVQTNLDKEIDRAKAAEKVNADAASKAQNDVNDLKTEVAKKAEKTDVDGLKTYVGEFTHDTAKTVIEYVNAKTDGIATSGNLEALGARVTSVEGEITGIKKDYLKGDDKTELEGKIQTAQAKADSAQTHSEGVASDLASAKASLEATDTAHAGRIAALEGKIEGVTGAMHFKGVEDKLPEDVSNYTEGDVILVGEKEYVFNGTEFKEFGDVSAEGKRIADLEGKMTTVEGDVAQAKTDITSNATAIGTKVDKTTFEAKVEELSGADSALDARLKAVEGKFGEGDDNVAAQIAKAKEEAINTASDDATTKANAAETNAKSHTNAEVAKDRARLDAIETAAESYATKTEVTAVSEKATANEGKITTLQTDLDEAKEKVTANEKAIAGLNTTVGTKAAQADLDAANAKIEANATAIADFVECSEEDILAIFKTN